MLKKFASQYNGRSGQDPIRVNIRSCIFWAVLVMPTVSGCAKSDSGLPAPTAATSEQTSATESKRLANAKPPETQVSNKSGDSKEIPKQEIAPQVNPDQSPKNGKPEEEEPRLLKTNTLLMLTYQPDIRASSLLNTMRPFMADNQVKEAKQIALTYDWQFQEILRRRADILENATDDQDIKAMLMETRVETADLIQVIRSRIMEEILTPEQRLQVQERYRKE